MYERPKASVNDLNLQSQRPEAYRRTRRSRTVDPPQRERSSQSLMFQCRKNNPPITAHFVSDVIDLMSNSTLLLLLLLQRCETKLTGNSPH